MDVTCPRTSWALTAPKSKDRQKVTFSNLIECRLRRWHHRAKQRAEEERQDRVMHAVVDAMMAEAAAVVS